MMPITRVADQYGYLAANAARQDHNAAYEDEARQIAAAHQGASIPRGLNDPRRMYAAEDGYHHRWEDTPFTQEEVSRGEPPHHRWEDTEFTKDEVSRRPLGQRYYADITPDPAPVGGSGSVGTPMGDPQGGYSASPTSAMGQGAGQGLAAGPPMAGSSAGTGYNPNTASLHWAGDPVPGYEGLEYPFAEHQMREYRERNDHGEPDQSTNPGKPQHAHNYHENWAGGGWESGLDRPFTGARDDLDRSW